MLSKAETESDLPAEFGKPQKRYYMSGFSDGEL